MIKHFAKTLLTFVLLTLKKELGVVKEILAVANSDFAGAFAKLVEVKLAIFAHSGDCLAIGKECRQLGSILLSCKHQFFRLCGVRRHQFRLNLVLQSLRLGADVGLEQEEKKMRVQVRSQLFQLSERVHFASMINPLCL